MGFTQRKVLWVHFIFLWLNYKNNWPILYKDNGMQIKWDAPLHDTQLVNWDQTHELMAEQND